jgi:prepilin-type N-terminal cleavage/methylation domain-containing protein/prepilin-type processing-associated H-X9-DG protein
MRTPGSRPASGFTLIELLVVIAIIGILIGLLLPAVQKVREAAARDQCQNNLKQIALAVHAYENTYALFPVDYWAGGAPNPGQEDKNSWSWLSAVLPFLEQDNLYRQGGMPTKTLRQSGVTGVSVKTFLCPSDIAPGIDIVGRGADIYAVDVPLALTNYKGVMGSNYCSGNTDWHNDGPSGNCDGYSKGDGIFYPYSFQHPLRITRISDGTSNTFMVGEDLPLKNRWSGWAFANHANCTCAIPPNVRHDPPYGEWDYANNWSFKSQHPGGVQFAYADGHVGFVPDSIPLILYRDLATIAGGEVVAPP